MSFILSLAAYALYTVFCLRILWHLLLWARASGAAAGYRIKQRNSLRTCLLMLVDIVTFRRVLLASGPLWFGSMLFHLSFLFVILRHLRFFTDPVPACVLDVQACGIIAGYLLPASVLYLLSIRLFSKKDRYLTYHNYLLLGLVLSISVTGLLIRKVFRADLVGIKEFMLGLLSFQPAGLGDGFLFAGHLFMVYFLVLILPSHLFSAPLVTIEARRREESVKALMHGEDVRRET